MTLTKEAVVIIGTGDYGRALGKRLLKNGYDVIYGSRYPGKRNLVKIEESLAGAKVLSIEEALRQSDVVFLAVNYEAYDTLTAYQSLLDSKILIDVSNSPSAPIVGSNAENLAAMFPGCRVVKAFNTISAYTLQSDAAGDTRQVFVCGEDAEARDAVKTLARNMGLSPVDCGGLSYANELEKQPHSLFDGWGWPTLATLIITILWTVYAIAHYYWIPESPTEPDVPWEHVPSTIMNMVAGCVSVTLLALCYLPGCFAAYLQLINGTKYKRFPEWMDMWLKSRKQLGLYALLYAAIHMILSVALLNEGYFEHWFRDPFITIPANHTGDVVFLLGATMQLSGELVILFGTLALATMSVVGVTSLPSVGAVLNWKEWTFMQSYLGWFCLMLSIVHVCVRGGYWWEFMITSPYGQGWKGVAQTLSFISMLLPWLCILLKLILIIPCVHCYLWRIRRGYERCSPKDDLEAPVPNESYSTVTTQSLGRRKNGEINGMGGNYKSNIGTMETVDHDDMSLAENSDLFYGGQENRGYENTETSVQL